jgi:hypothetical protein
VGQKPFEAAVDRAFGVANNRQHLCPRAHQLRPALHDEKAVRDEAQRLSACLERILQRGVWQQRTNPRRLEMLIHGHVLDGNSPSMQSFGTMTYSGSAAP